MTTVPAHSTTSESVWNSDALKAAWESVERGASPGRAIEGLILDSIFALSVGPNGAACPPQPNDSDGLNEALLEHLTSQRLGRYELRGFIGRGGFGIVLRAHDAELARDVALKIPRPEFLTHPEVSSRFLHEARAASSLRHPGIVQVHDVGTFGSVPYIATDLCLGTNLATWLDRRGDSLTPRMAAELVHDIADAVGYAHLRGIIHQDLKPANILVEPSHRGTNAWHPQLTDFGLACHLRDDGGIDAAHTGGTRQYMAPEQAAGKAAMISTHTDVYALGLVLRDLLTHMDHSPHGVDETRAMADASTHSGACQRVDEFVRPRKVPLDLWAIYQRCVQEDPNDRYRTGSDLRDDLARFLDGRPVKARPVSPVGLLTLAAKRHPWSAALLSLLIIGTLTALPTFAWLYWKERIARQRERTTRIAAKEMMDSMYARVIDDKLLDVPGMDKTRSELMQELLAFYQASAREYARDSESLFNLQVAWHHSANLLSQLGRAQDAQEQRRQCLAIIDRLLQRDPTNRDYRFAKFHNLLLLGEQSLAHDGSGRDMIQEACAIIFGLERDYPGDVDIEEAAISACTSLSRVSTEQYKSVAEQYLREALRRLHDFEERHGTSENVQRKHFHILGILASLASRKGDRRAAAELLGEADLVADRLLASNPTSREFRLLVCGSKVGCASTLALQGRYSEAKRVLLNTIDLARNLANDYPGDCSAREQLPCVTFWLARACWDQGDADAARRHYLRGLELVDEYCADFPTDSDFRRRLVGYTGDLPEKLRRSQVENRPVGLTDPAK